MRDGTKVYVLGAGCSARYGYPLGTTFLKELEAFGETLTDRHTTRIKLAVETTVTLLKARNIPSIDELVARINNRTFDDKSLSSIAKERGRYDKIYDAKIAALALFLSREPAAFRSGLRSYSQLLRDIFPGHSHWEQQLKDTDFRILTFNYDRLFERAFLDRFGVDVGVFPLYGGGVLNSGLNVIQRGSPLFEHKRFCFLKMHGSVGMAARDEHGKPSHYHDCSGLALAAPKTLVDDDVFPRAGTDPGNPRPEPLIVFPHERDYVRSNENWFPYREYISKVWEQAEKLLAEASEIWVVGYSFSPIDRPSVLKLLSGAKSCKNIVVQNPEARKICAELSRKFSGLNLPFDPYECEF